MPTHQYYDGNETPASRVSPTLEVERVSSSDDLHDHRLQPHTIQWDENTERLAPLRRASSSASASRRPISNNASRSGSNVDGRRPSFSNDSDLERDLALASPTLPPSAMPSVLLTDNRSFNDNRSFVDMELPLPGVTERPREDSDVISLPSSSGLSSRSVSPDSPRGEDFHRHHQPYHRRSTARRRGTTDARAFNTPRRPTVSERDRRPTVTDGRRPTTAESHPRRGTYSDGRPRAPTISSVVDSDDGISHVDSSDDRSDKAEEDVCFPMDHDDEHELHRDQRGIDFEDMEDFAREMRDLLGGLNLSDEQRRAVENRDMHPIRRNRSGSRVSTAEEKKELYSNLHHHPAFNPKFERGSSSDSVEDEKFNARLALPKLSKSNTIGSVTQPRPNRGDRKHDRFTFFTPGMEETNQAEEFCDLVKPGETYAELFDQSKGTWWLDVLNPSVEEMKMLSKAFNIHPLTNEDIRTQESREKVELFRTYYFVCFRSFENDAESEGYLEAANMYIVVFRGGLLTFHFTTTPHAANVRRRIRQLRDYVSVSSDWICYALIDDITDAFGPLVHAVEGETEAIEDAVMIARIDETGDMLMRISLLRKKIMGLLKLLGGKADVIKMFAKRCNENWDVAPTGEIGLYLGDIQGTPHPLAIYPVIADC